MYFKNFPKTFYDFNVTGNSNDTTRLHVLTDITKNVRVRKKILENITLYDEYDIIDGETPELIAEKFYGNAELHWVIMLVNQRYDYLKDFPMSSMEIDEYTSTKYGEENKYKVHHYEKDGIVSSAAATLRVPVETILPYSLFKKYDFLTNNSGTVNARVENVDTENRLLELSVSNGVFVYNEEIIVKGFRLNEETGANAFVNGVFAFRVLNNSFTIGENYFPISNIDYEIAENEKKRRIKMISPNLVNQIITEFENLI